MIHDIATCQQCTDHPCYDACPAKDKAMVLREDGVAVIQEENCIGCGLCQRACRFTPSRINLVKNKEKDKRKAKKCDLCASRAEGPACVQYCPARCLAVSGDVLPWEQEASPKSTAFVDIYAAAADNEREV